MERYGIDEERYRIDEELKNQRSGELQLHRSWIASGGSAFQPPGKVKNVTLTGLFWAAD